jgi:hypothetical protein
MLRRTILSVLMIVLCFCTAVSIARAGKVELTTYYPAPYGEYKELTTTEKASFATSSGSVGIGTTTPANKLDVEGEVAVGAGYSGTSVAPTNGMIVQGNVGIGTSGPSATSALTVVGLDTPLGGAFPQQIYVASSDAAANRLEIGYLYDSDASQYGRLQAWGTTGAQTIRLNDAGGSVLIGVPAVLAVGETVPLLNVAGRIKATEVRVEADGDVGTPSLMLGDGNTGFYPGSGTGALERVFVTVNGTLACTFAPGSVTHASDIAGKKDVENIGYGLDTVLKMEPRSYVLKSTGDKQIGFVAQELEKVVPEAVSGDDGSKGVAYGNLTAVLAKAIQEQQAEIESLKKEIEALKKQ